MPDAYSQREDKPAVKPVPNIKQVDTKNSLTALNTVFDAFVDREYDFIESKKEDNYKSIM
jgi:hypothetical protein